MEPNACEMVRCSKIPRYTTVDKSGKKRIVRCYSRYDLILSVLVLLMGTLQWVFQKRPMRYLSR